MNYSNLRAAMHPHLLRVPISQLSLCPDCGEFYRNDSPVWCRQSEGMEWVERECPTFECADAREARL